MGKNNQISKGKIINIILGICMQIYFLYPWICAEQGRYNAITYIFCVIKQGGFKKAFCHSFSKGAELIPDSMGVLTFQFNTILALVFIVQILAVCAIVISFRKDVLPRWIYGISLFSVAFTFIVWTADTMPDTSVGYVPRAEIITRTTYMYPLVFIFVTVVWLLLMFMADDLDNVSEMQRQKKEAAKEFRIERKRRLKFPGKYSKLYYRVVWKNLKYGWKDYCFLLAAGIISTLFLFSGLGIREVFSKNYGQDYGFVMGAGLMRIMLDFLVVVVIIDFTLLSTMLTYYRKKRSAGNVLLEILGTRSKTMSSNWAWEMLITFLVSVAGGIGIGKILISLFRQGMEYLFPEMGQLGNPGWTSYVGTVAGILVISLYALGSSRDREAMKSSSEGRIAAIRREKLPGKFQSAGIVFGAILAAYGIYRFAQRRTAESIFVLGLFLCGMYFILRNVWGAWLKQKQKKKKEYIQSLLKHYVVRYKFQTTVKYISILTVIHVCALFFFTMKIVSNHIAESPKELYPYDFVCLANESDEDIFEKIRKECDAQIYTVPMVRVSTPDNTEAPNTYSEQVYPQGESIGISESAYRELKMLIGEKPKEDLKLDDEGKNIYVVYQQDKGTRAQPIDWYLGSKTPYLHIGQPVTYCDPYERKDIYPKRTIVGEEVGSVLGAFCQGSYENLVVFSDAYFEKAKDFWKTTDILTGKQLAEEEIIPGENVYEGPTRLQLLKVPQKYYEKAGGLLEEFRSNHVYEDGYNPLVQSAYSKSEAARQRKIEHLMEETVNGFIIVMLLIVSFFLLHMKVKMEIPEMQSRYYAMGCFGMKQSERIKALKEEVSRFVKIPLYFTVPIALVFTGITFYLRRFTSEHILQYILYAAIVWGIYIGAQMINLKCVQREVIRKVEDNIGR